MPDRSSSPAAQLLASLSRFPPETAALAKACLQRLRRALPGVPQLVYGYARSVVVSFSPSERGAEGAVALAVEARGVRLYVPKDVPDPARRLEGAGSKVRSVRIEAASELDRGDVHALLRAAIERAGIAPARGRSSRVVVRSAPAVKRPRRSGGA